MRTKSYKYTYNQWSEPFDPTLDSESTAVFVFFESTLVVDEQIKKIKDTFPKSKILGSSTSGEIQNAEINDNSIICMVIKFDHTRLKLVSTPVNFETSLQAGKNLAEALAAPDLKNIVLLTEGLDVDGSELIKELDQALKNKNINTSIVGGMAGDGSRFINTFLINDTSVKTHQAVALGLYGEKVQMFSGTGTGWAPFGPLRYVTKAERNTVFEIDGVPALKLYKEYLKEDAQNLPVSGVLFPLGISWGENENIVRSVARIDESNNALIFASKIPEKTQVQLMHSNVMKLIGAAEDALKDCSLNFTNGQSTAALIISCIGRRMIMGQKTEDEISIIKELLPNHAEICGFYSYGEYSPTASKRNELHNQTMTLIVFQEGS
ncbi:FIST signal transduction protein [Pseudobdellovibrio sp. HCB154]|uniref:FIST signal transduction protein n=1 Tax=Pseudobdellovibrio sp. HCB154 TaxID=3386277 RepID=UPI003916E6E0